MIGRKGAISDISDTTTHLRRGDVRRRCRPLYLRYTEHVRWTLWISSSWINTAKEVTWIFPRRASPPAKYSGRGCKPWGAFALISAPPLPAGRARYFTTATAASSLMKRPRWWPIPAESQPGATRELKHPGVRKDALFHALLLPSFPFRSLSLASEQSCGIDQHHSTTVQRIYFCSTLTVLTISQLAQWHPDMLRGIVGPRDSAPPNSPLLPDWLIDRSADWLARTLSRTFEVAVVQEPNSGQLYMTSVSHSLPLFLSLLPGYLSTGVGRAGRRVGVTVIVVALRWRAVVTLYSPFAQLRELKLLDRHCTPTMEVMSLVFWRSIM